MSKQATSPIIRHMRPELFILGVAGIVTLLFLSLSRFTGGFPLDDGWIHQTYARNFAATGRWEYVPGAVSAGSTAPLWTLWLAVGYLLRLPYGVWVFGSGWLALGWTGIAGMKLWQKLWVKEAHLGWVAGILIVTAWQLVWAAGSGMETLPFVALGLTILIHYLDTIQSTITAKRVVTLGALCGILMLIRPDGLLLLLLIFVGLLWHSEGIKQAGINAGIFLIATIIPLLPYFVLNYIGGGTILPNTFYAKQTEYAILLAQPLPLRFLRLLYFSLGGAENGWQGISGAHWILLVGWMIAGIHALKNDLTERHFAHTIPLLWAGGHVLLYAWRLPVTYQHGRYLLPALPISILYGWRGWVELFQHSWLRAGRWGRVMRNAGIGVITLLWGFFLLVGGGQYATDVAFINGEMVQIAHWLNDNTPPDALIASHDIGAIGYFTQRPILDLAGLISPEIIPFLDDERAIADYLLDSEADFLVTAPGWRYEMVVNAGTLSPIYSTNYSPTRQQQLNNMTVYSLKK